LAYYNKVYYTGYPALKLNHYCVGKEYYIASRNKRPFLTEFYTVMVNESGVKHDLVKLTHDVTAQCRTDGIHDYVYVFNFSKDAKMIALKDTVYIDLLSETTVPENIELPSLGVRVLRRKSRC